MKTFLFLLSIGSLAAASFLGNQSILRLPAFWGLGTAFCALFSLTYVLLHDALLKKANNKTILQVGIIIFATAVQYFWMAIVPIMAIPVIAQNSSLFFLCCAVTAVTTPMTVVEIVVINKEEERAIRKAQDQIYNSQMAEEPVLKMETTSQQEASLLFEDDPHLAMGHS